MLARQLAIKKSPFDFPDFRPQLSIFDAIANPGLLGEHPGITSQIFDWPADVFLTRASSLKPTTANFLGWTWQDKRGFRQPTMKIAGNFADIALIQRVQPTKELRVFAVGFIECPRTNFDPIRYRMLDLRKSNLLLGLEFNRRRNVVFLRRASSSVQDLGRYMRLSRRHWKPGAE